MGQFFSDLRYGIRLLIHGRLTTAAAIVSLALGIGGTTAMFTVVDAILLRPLPYAEPDRLVMVYESSRRYGGRGGLTPADFLDYRRDARASFDGMTSFMGYSTGLTGDGDPEQIRVQSVSGNFFTLLGVPAIVGRTFVPTDDAPGTPEQVILSEGLWKRRYGGRADAIGRTVTIADRRVQVVGVMPAGFRVAAAVDAWVLGEEGVPRSGPTLGSFKTNRDINILGAIGRLGTGVAEQSAQAELDGIAARLEKQYPQWNTDTGVLIEPLQRALVGDTRRVLLVLLGAVVLLLLIASVNVANLLLVRAQGRTLELAMRSALGASRRRLAAQMLVESLLLAALGGILGVSLAAWAVDGLVRLAPTDLAPVDRLGLDLRVLLFATAVTALTGLGFGLWPAWRASRTSLAVVMNAAARGAVGRDRRRAQHLLVSSELAIALVLLVGAGLLITSFTKLLTIDTGFDTRHLIAVDVSLPGARYSADPARKARFHEAVLERVQGEPGVEAVTQALSAPMGTAITRGVWIQGQPDPRPGEAHGMSFQTISERYFQTVGVPLRQGRAFTRDDHSGAPRVAIVNEAFGRRYFPGQNPVGQRIGFGGGPRDGNYWRTIVGVAADTRERAASPPTPTAYVPYRQDGEPWNFGSFVVKSPLPATQVGEAVRRAVLAADPDQPISRVRTIEDAMRRGIAVQQFTTVVASLFAGLALLLAAVGTFGVMSHIVSSRTREIGVRLALGAQRRDIVRLVLGQALRVVIAASIAGVTAALLAGASLRTLLFDVTPGDPGTLAAAVGLLACTALAASYVPVRRALAQNPLGNLRND